ncbi:MAG: aminotransferase [Robiginitomaculum sp.]|nr:MAG: aminotransferase [Robiginitomaculum sp.]
MKPRLYLDHNASSPARPEVITAMVAALNTPGNASTPHGAGRAASKLVSDGREAVGLAMGVCAQDIVFMGSGTEAINTAIKSVVDNGTKRMLVSGMDHPAAIVAAEASGAKVDIIPTLSTGQMDLDWLAQTLADWDADDGAPFLTMSAANSETGVLQDVEKAADLVHAVKGYILVDAVQSLGKMPMLFIVDYLAVSAHKIGGPQGVGALYVSPDAPYSSLIIGGGQEKRRRAGTINVAGIAGFGAAAKIAENLSHTRAIRDAIEKGLKALEPHITIFGEGAERLPNTSLFAVPDVSSSTLMMGLDLEGISVSTGLACSSGKVGASRAVTAMGLADKAPHGAIRLSLGYTSQPEDAARFLNAWTKIRKIAIRGAA